MYQVGQRAHHLRLSYREFIRNNRSLEGLTIGSYKVQRQLGKGAFGNIYLAQNQRKQLFALKLLNLVAVREESNPKVKQIRERLVKSQPSLMQQCDSPNVLKCYDIFQNQDLKVLVLEYCSGKTLEEYIKRKKRIPQEEAVVILRQIINGLAELHRNNIVHRDLKSENVMEHEGCYKIIDLGFSKKLEIINQTTQFQGTTLGTITTMAPQVMSRKNYGLKADIWSLGVIFFQMIFGEMPYDSLNAKKRYEQIEQKQYFNPNNPLTINKVTASKLASDFFSKVFQVDTEKRMDWKQLIQHQLIKQKMEQEQLCPRFLQRPYTIQQPVVHKSLIQQGLNQEQIQIEKKLKKQGKEDKKDQINLSQKTNQKIVDPKTRFQEYIKNKKSVINIQEPTQIDIPKNEQISNLQKQRNNIQQPRQISNFPTYIQQNQSTKIYKWCRQGHLQCLKTELIYNKIILPIETKEMLNLKDRQVVQLMFLLSTRCFNNMSPISFKITNQKYQSNRMIKNLYEQVRPLYQKVSEKFIKYSQNLTAVQNKYISIIKDFFSRKFLARNYDQKNRLTTGLQGQQMNYGDYSKKQQIDYTFDNYISSLLPKINDTTVKKYLSNYKKLTKVTFEQLQGDNFEEYVKQIIFSD